MLGNIVRHRRQFFEKQYPYLPSNHPRLPVKLKPLYRLDAREIRTYCRIKEIIPLAAKCPHSRGATSHAYQEALELLESKMPGTKRDFLFSYIDSRKPPRAHRGTSAPAHPAENRPSEICAPSANCSIV